MKFSKELLELLQSVPTGNVADNNPNGYVMDSGIRPIDPELKLIGPALTVSGKGGDNLYVYHALKQAKEGYVLVIDAKAYCEGGHLGDMVVNDCIRLGMKGIVIDGSCRDREDIRKLKFPVFCRGFSPRSTTKEFPGTIGQPIVAGGVPVNTGDLIFADCDGVVVIPEKDIDDVITNAIRKHEKEEKMQEAMNNGKALIDLLHFREKLQ
ncbi:MAG: RraA family protein [Erysipelotrichaceae bacterium]|nr:RraA family protein [Erysipelotrichaceae bacterium]